MTQNLALQSGRRAGPRGSEAEGREPTSQWRPPWKRGWSTVGEKHCFFRSSWEANYARYLQWLKEADEIVDWAHEPETLWLGSTGYIPDFRVKECDGSTTYHEVKGFMDYRSRSKLALLAKRYPAIDLRLVTQREYFAIEKQFSAYVEGWQCQKKKGRASVGAGRPSRRSLRCRVNKSIEQLLQSLGSIINLYGDIDLRVCARAESIRSDIRLLEEDALESLNEANSASLETTNG